MQLVASERLHQDFGLPQPRLWFWPQAGAQAGHYRRRVSRDGVVEGRAIRIEGRGPGLVRIAPAFDFPAGEME